MLKRLLIILSLSFFIFWSNVSIALDFFGPDDWILQSDIDWVVDDKGSNSIREWWGSVAGWLWWVENPDIDNSEDAKDKTLSFVKKIVDFLLWILWLVALIYIIYWWVIAITASWNEDKFKKWIWMTKIWLIAIVWIWFSWLIVSFIFWLVISSTT